MFQSMSLLLSGNLQEY